MRSILLAISFLLSFYSHGQSRSGTDAAGKDTIMIGKLVGLVMHPGDCGWMTFASVQKFSLIKAPGFIKGKTIRLGIACPELFGRGLFVSGKSYKLWLSSVSEAREAIKLEEGVDKPVAPKYWVTKVEKLN